MSANENIIVELYEGTQLHFPAGTDPEVIKRVTKEQTLKINLTDEPPPPAPPDLPWYLDAYEWTKKNMELPLGVGGAAVGGFLGTALGPPGIVAGTLIGGAVGSGGGSVASDVLQDVPIDYADALKEAAISAGIDIVTLGVGSKIKAFIQARKALGVSPQETAKQLIKAAEEGTAAGSEQSLRATQKILSEGGATLVPSQTGRSSALSNFSESIAEIGVLSGAILDENVKRVNNVIENSLTEIIKKSSVGGLDPASLGEELNTVIRAGRNAMVSAYGEGLQKLALRVGKGSASTKSLNNRIKAFRSKYVTTETVDGIPIEAVSNLSKQTNAFIAELNKTLRLPTLTGESLLALDKSITGKVTEITESLGKGESGVVTKDLHQIQELEKTLKEGIQNLIRDINPEAAISYKRLKKEYSKNMGGLLPTINSNMLSGIAANKKGFEVLGKMLTTVQSPEKIEAFMGSIDTAYKILGKDSADALTFKTAAEAKDAIKASFLEKSFNMSAFDSVDFSGYKSLVKQWGSKSGRRSLNAVFGKDAPRVIQLVNMMSETSTKADSNFLGLAIRGKEVGAAGQIIGASFTGLGGAAAILGLPVVLARAATNSKATNLLLSFEKKKFTSEEAKQTAASIILTNILADLTIDEREELKLKIQLEEKQKGQ